MLLRWMICGYHTYFFFVKPPWSGKRFDLKKTWVSGQNMTNSPFVCYDTNYCWCRIARPIICGVTPIFSLLKSLHLPVISPCLLLESLFLLENHDVRFNTYIRSFCWSNEHLSGSNNQKTWLLCLNSWSFKSPCLMDFDGLVPIFSWLTPG